MNELKDPDDLGIMLRQTLRAREADAPGSSGLLADVRAGISRRARARRRLAALGAVAAVVAAGTSAALLTSLAGSRNPPPALAAGTPHDLVVNGMRAWSFHGLQVRVPQAWPVNALMCGTPVKTTVEVDPGGIPRCRITEPPVVETVLLGTPQQVSVPPSHHQVTVGGQRGTLGIRRLPDGLTSEVLVLPGISAAAEADIRAPALAAAIIASARGRQLRRQRLPEPDRRAEAGRPGGPARRGTAAGAGQSRAGVGLSLHRPAEPAGGSAPTCHLTVRHAAQARGVLGDSPCATVGQVR